MSVIITGESRVILKATIHFVFIFGDHISNVTYKDNRQCSLYDLQCLHNTSSNLSVMLIHHSLASLRMKQSSRNQLML